MRRQETMTKNHETVAERLLDYCVTHKTTKNEIMHTMRARFISDVTKGAKKDGGDCSDQWDENEGEEEEASEIDSECDSP